MSKVVIIADGKGATAALQAELEKAGVARDANGDWLVASPQCVARGVTLWTLDDSQVPTGFVTVCQKVAGVTVETVGKTAEVRSLASVKAMEAAKAIEAEK